MTLEKKIERDVCDEVKEQLGVLGVKFTTPGRKGYPDRIFFIPGGKPLLIEFKRDGEDPEPYQAYIHEILRGLSYEVQVHDNFDTAISAVRTALESATQSARRCAVPTGARLRGPAAKTR